MSNKQITQSLKKEIENIKAQIEDVSNQIEHERSEMSEENSVLQELIDKKEILIGQLELLQSGIPEAEMSKLNKKVYFVKINGETRELNIVPSSQANPPIGLISDDSPLAQSLQKAKAGETIVVKTPIGESKYKVVKVN